MTRKNKQFKIEDGKLLVGTSKFVPRTIAGDCYFCGEPVYISQGQLLKYLHEQPTHKKCRK